jgi:AcrR family transcriptional regulator
MTSRERILAAARAEFAELGIAGARVGTIAKNAQINKERLYAYFGNKEGLFEAVLAQSFSQLSAEVSLPSTEEELFAYAGLVFDFHYRNPEFTRLLAWESLHYGSSALPHEASRRSYYSEKMREVSGALGSSAEAGALILTLIGLAAWPILMAPLSRHLLGLEPGEAIDPVFMKESVLHSARAVISAHLAPAG